MTFPVKLKFNELHAEYAMSLGDPEVPFNAVISGADAGTAENVPRDDDHKLFSRCRDPPSRSTTATRPLHIGDSAIPTQYSSPYPLDFNIICVCEFCLKYMANDYSARRHSLKCPWKTPPGTEIYRDGDWSIWEVDGAEFRTFCQNLCLLAKLFLESKTLYYDVDPFNFYVLTKLSPKGARIVGYFSKQKLYCGPQQQPGQPTNNVSCIMVLPIKEYRGIGQFLISFSYLLTRIQGVTGSPEKPLSSLGAKSYETYWKYILAKFFLLHSQPNVSIAAISNVTRLTLNDTIYGLEILGWFKHGSIEVDREIARVIVEKWEKQQALVLKEDCLMWCV